MKKKLSSWAFPLTGSRIRKVIILLLIIGSSANKCLNAQTEVMAWSNITGIRVEGQLMEFESSLRVVDKDWQHINATARERQITQIVEDIEKGSAKVTVTVTSEADTTLEGVFFSIYLPDHLYSDGKIRAKNTASSEKSNTPLASILSTGNPKPLIISSKGVIIESSKIKLEIDADAGSAIIARREAGSGGVQLYARLLGQKI